MRSVSTNPILGRSALSSYRADLPSGGAPPAEVDGQTIIVATLLRHAVSATQTVKDRNRIVREATRLAKASLGKNALARGCAYDPPGRGTNLDVLRLLAERTEQRGSLEMAANLFESLVGLAKPGSLAAGRILAERARNASKRGYLDLSLAQIEHLQRIARRARSKELEVRALLGHASLAQQRGNYPAVYTYASRAVRVAEANKFKRLASVGYNALAFQSAMVGRLVRAAGFVWKAFAVSATDDGARQELLVGLGQIFIESGHPALARDAFTVALNAKPVVRFALPALGGYAIASAAVRDSAAVHLTSRRVLALGRLRGHRREFTTALLDCAVAYANVGQARRAETLTQRAVRLAITHGFHDLAHQADARQNAAASAPVVPIRLTGGAAAAARWVTESAVGGLHARLAFAGADQ